MAIFFLWSHPFRLILLNDNLSRAWLSLVFRFSLAFCLDFWLPLIVLLPKTSNMRENHKNVGNSFRAHHLIHHPISMFGVLCPVHGGGGGWRCLRVYYFCKRNAKERFWISGLNDSKIYNYIQKLDKKPQQSFWDHKFEGPKNYI